MSSTRPSNQIGYLGQHRMGGREIMGCQGSRGWGGTQGERVHSEGKTEAWRDRLREDRTERERDGWRDGGSRREGNG